MSPMRSSATARSHLKRHPRRARHPRLHRLGEQAQCGRAAAVGANRLGHQQLGQQRVGKLRPELAATPKEPSAAGYLWSRRPLAGRSSASPASISSSDICVVQLRPAR